MRAFAVAVGCLSVPTPGGHGEPCCEDRRYGAPSPKKQDEGECDVRSREASPESDVDVLYELEPGARLGWDIEKLADELAGLLGRPVDLVSRNSLHERLRDQVLAEALPLYAV